MGNKGGGKAAKTIGSKRFFVDDPIFGQRIYVFLNCKEQVFIDWQKRLNVANLDGIDPNHHAFSTHISGEGEPNKYVIWLNHFDWTLDDQASLIHEIIHTVIRIWDANNIKFSVETQEFYAHSVDKLYMKIARKINW